MLISIVKKGLLSFLLLCNQYVYASFIKFDSEPSEKPTPLVQISGQEKFLFKDEADNFLIFSAHRFMRLTSLRDIKLLSNKQYYLVGWEHSDQLEGNREKALEGLKIVKLEPRRTEKWHKINFTINVNEVGRISILYDTDASQIKCVQTVWTLPLPSEFEDIIHSYKEQKLRMNIQSRAAPAAE